jgi:hypothetical protein
LVCPRVGHRLGVVDGEGVVVSEKRYWYAPSLGYVPGPGIYTLPPPPHEYWRYPFAEMRFPRELSSPVTVEAQLATRDEIEQNVVAEVW